MIKMMLKTTVSHMALRIGMAAWAYKMAAPEGAAVRYDPEQQTVGWAKEP